MNLKLIAAIAFTGISILFPVIFILYRSIAEIKQLKREGEAEKAFGKIKDLCLTLFFIITIVSLIISALIFGYDNMVRIGIDVFMYIFIPIEAGIILFVFLPVNVALRNRYYKKNHIKYNEYVEKGLSQKQISLKCSKSGLLWLTVYNFFAGLILPLTIVFILNNSLAGPDIGEFTRSIKEIGYNRKYNITTEPINGMQVFWISEELRKTVAVGDKVVIKIENGFFGYPKVVNVEKL